MTVRLFGGRLVLARRETTAPAQDVNGILITPVARMVMLRLPFGAIAWHRPAAVLVAQDGTTTRLPIRNLTRLLLLGIASIIPLVILAVRHITPSEEETDHGDQR